MLLLLHHHLMLVELVDCIRVNILEKVRRSTHCWLLVVAKVLLVVLIWLLLNPQVFGRLKIVSEDRNYLSNLFIRVPIHEEIGINVCVFGFFTPSVQVQLYLYLSSATHWLLTTSKTLVFIGGVELLNLLGKFC